MRLLFGTIPVGQSKFQREDLPLTNVRKWWHRYIRFRKQLPEALFRLRWPSLLRRRFWRSQPSNECDCHYRLVRRSSRYAL
jgi:hypothetical protein